MLTYHIYSFESNELSKHEELLTRVINRGYNVPRFKYNIILSPRIKNSIREDLMIKYPNKSYLILAFSDKDANIDETDNASIAREKFIHTNNGLGLLNDLSSSIVLIDKSAGGENELHFPINAESKILGMCGLKPHDPGYEITSFVSFYPRIGSNIIDKLEKFAKTSIGNEEIWVLAISEHELRELYEKFGYVYKKKVLISVTANSGSCLDEKLENDIEASQDFHLDVLVKQL